MLWAGWRVSAVQLMKMLSCGCRRWLQFTVMAPCKTGTVLNSLVIWLLHCHSLSMELVPILQRKNWGSKRIPTLVICLPSPQDYTVSLLWSSCLYLRPSNSQFKIWMIFAHTCDCWVNIFETRSGSPWWWPFKCISKCNIRICGPNVRKILRSLNLIFCVLFYIRPLQEMLQTQCFRSKRCCSYGHYAKWYKSDRERQVSVWSHLYVESKKNPTNSQKQRSELWLTEAGDGRWEN